MSQTIHLNELEGYNEELESDRKEKFREFTASSDADEKRIALESFASLTSLRSMTFINAFDEALGLR